MSGRSGDTILVGQASRIRFASSAAIADEVDAKRTIIVADELTSRLIPASLAACPVAIVPRGEEAKKLAVLDSVYSRFLEAGVGRDWGVLAVGGGSVSDLAGFAAATWMRGIAMYCMPTTMLAMVDASVGGKNGIDFHGYKNLIGTFSQPVLVIIDPENLTGLPGYDLAGGMAEALKHAIIDGESHFGLIEQATGSIDFGRPADPRRDGKVLEAVIRESVRVKASIVNNDEKETGTRRLLNLGHTVGHAVEAVTGLSHGACVAVGILAALRLASTPELCADSRSASWLGALPKVNAQETDRLRARVEKAIHALGLPVTIEDARKASAETRELSPAAFRDAVADTIQTDKKMTAEGLVFALPTGMGDVRLVPLPLECVRDFVRRAP